MPTIRERFTNAWNAFTSRDPTDFKSQGMTYYTRPDRPKLSPGHERSIVNAIYNRIAIDASSVKLVHARLDQNGRYLEEINSGLNNVLNVEANLDQTGRAYIQDIIMSLLDEGCIAAVPTYTDINPKINNSYDILEMRVGKIVQWYPDKVRINLYNEENGKHEEILMPKKSVAIIENPLYSVMNEPNATLQRLIRKLNLLDVVDEQSSSGKMDLIIQLPYLIKTEARKKQAEERRKEIEMQLTGSKYGIAYTDGTEKITQLNRSIENNLLQQIEFLTNMLYGQLGMTKEVFEGTANEAVMLDYYNRTIEPILSAITDEFNRKFLTKTARTQKQSIVFFRDPFKLVPVNQIAEIADKFTRNEILSSNEVRGIIGFKPVNDPKADELRNKNLNESEGQTFATTQEEMAMPEDALASDYAENQNEGEISEEFNPMMIPVSMLMNDEEIY